MGFHLKNCRAECLEIAVYRFGYAISVHGSSLWSGYVIKPLAPPRQGTFEFFGARSPNVSETLQSRA